MRDLWQTTNMNYGDRVAFILLSGHRRIVDDRSDNFFVAEINH